jgi:AcrR family transcriptional regulator
MATEKNKKWKAPALRLMDAAEKLFGEHGVDGVSLVEIAKKAGQANKYAVQYHFESRENLVRAIFETRLERIGERRQKRLDAISASGESTVTTLLAAFIYPVFEEVGPDGLHYYARFSRRVLDSPLAGITWYNDENFTTAAEVRRRIRELTPQLQQAEFDVKLGLAVELLIGALAMIDRAITARTAAEPAPAQPNPVADSYMLETAIEIAAAAFK